MRCRRQDHRERDAENDSQRAYEWLQLPAPAGDTLANDALSRLTMVSVPAFPFHGRAGGPARFDFLPKCTQKPSHRTL